MIDLYMYRYYNDVAILHSNIVSFTIFFTECNYYGDIRLVDTSVQYGSNGTTEVTGVLEFCNYGTWNTVCKDSITQNDVAKFCTQYGYESKI